MAYSDQQMLNDIETAIQDIIGGRVTTYVVDGRSATYQDIGKLYDMRRRLQQVLGRASSGVFSVAEFRNPR